MSKQITIAIADDHYAVREALKMQLKEFGFDVILEGDDGEILIDNIKNSSIKPDLCIIDGNMPVMDGPQTVEVIKLMWPKIKLLGFSFNSDNRELMMEKGADAFLLKSCAPEQLRKAIKHLVNPEST